MLTVMPGRSEGGSSSGAGGVGTVGDTIITLPVTVPPGVKAINVSRNRLAGMDDIGTRLLAGGFFNYNLMPQWRLTSTALWGAGKERNGVSLELGVQRLAADIAPHHTLALSASVTAVNRDYNQSYFGVTLPEAVHSDNRPYDAAGGLKDARLGARWNWALAPSWLLTSNLQAERLLGSARNSPLVERPTNVTVSTALAYRF
jgi:outer membrane scaffolding protein for murein synthesis (MipA/OmpV family)